MNSSIRKATAVFCAFVAASAALMLASASPALADQPMRFEIPIDDTFIIPAGEFTCNFDIEQRVVGTLRATVYFDRNGNPIREIDTAPNLRVTFTNPANGRSVSTVSPATSHITIREDGSFIFAIVGLQGHIVVPGQGVVTMDAGRLEFRMDCPTCPPEFALHGRFDFSLFPTVCGVLQ